MPSSLTLSTFHWPLVTLELPANMAELDLTTLTAEQDEIFARRAKYVSITDASAVARFPGAKTRAEIARWARDIEPRVKVYQVANALVVPSPVARGVLTAVHWLAPPPVPTLVCATMGEGLAFLTEHARQAGLDLEPISRFAAGYQVSRAAG